VQVDPDRPPEQGYPAPRSSYHTERDEDMSNLEQVQQALKLVEQRDQEQARQEAREKVAGYIYDLERELEHKQASLARFSKTTADLAEQVRELQARVAAAESELALEKTRGPLRRTVERDDRGLVVSIVDEVASE
jgi:septal ring factor EnvC (AmiA/AmiB activator)